MSRSSCVYVGPYAMWLDADPPVDPETDDVMFCGVLWGHWEDGGVQVEPGRRPVRAIFFSPHPDSPRAGGPRAAFTYCGPPGGGVGLDLRGVDAEAELEAFRVAYKVELETMAHSIGRPPVLRWGVIYTEG
jgi:hypothetical protein